MKRVPIFLIGIFVISIFFYYNTNRKDEIDKVALEDLNLQLVGVVDSVDKAIEGHYHGFGVIRLQIISSNIQEYHPPDDQKFYYCVIKNNKAEIYGHASSTLKGDTLVIDTKAKLISKLRNGKNEEVGTITINPSKSYYEYIQKYHRKF
jgi:hypothetical protein